MTPDYFRTIRIPVLAGRAFTSVDRASGPLVAIIDERLAKLFGGADPVGWRVRIPIPGAPWGTIVGVVGHIRHERVDEDTRPQIYFPFEQRTQDRVALVVRTRTDPAAIGSTLAAAIRAVDPEQAIYDARTLAAVVARSVQHRWLQTALLGTFAVVAVFLASIGIYGVIAQAVGQRRREFAIRLALGARRGEIVTLVLRHGAMLFAVGPRSVWHWRTGVRALSAVCCSASRRSMPPASAWQRQSCSWSRWPPAAFLPGAQPASIRPSPCERVTRQSL